LPIHNQKDKPMKKLIFGYNVHIEPSEYEFEIEKGFLLYPNAETNSKRKTININIKHKFERFPRLNRPIFESATEKGFSIRYRYADIVWDLRNIEIGQLDIDIIVIKNHTINLSNLERILSLDYKAFPDTICQVMHEKILVPAVLLFQDKVILHGASLYNKESGNSIIFGGTGGVGKTSSLLKLGYNRRDAIFLSDDIVVVGKNGIIYPNYANPKIYAYNTENNDHIERLLLQNKTLIDKFHWKTRKLVGKSWVRRTIRPNIIYNTDYIEPRLKIKLFLYRNDCVRSTCSDRIDKVTSAALENAIISMELIAFFNFIRLYEYHAIAMKRPLFVRLENLKESLDNGYNKIFAETRNYIVKISKRIPHNQFLETFASELQEIVNENNNI
jgi:hypothetical protein